MHSDSGWFWLWMSVMMMVIFWGAVIFGIFWLTRGTVRGSSTPGEPFVTRESPLDILERRFAEGAVTEEDYRARREVLIGGTANSNGARKAERLTASQAVGRRQQ